MSVYYIYDSCSRHRHAARQASDTHHSQTWTFTPTDFTDWQRKWTMFHVRTQQIYEEIAC